MRQIHIKHYEYTALKIQKNIQCYIYIKYTLLIYKTYYTMNIQNITHYKYIKYAKLK